VDSLSQSPVRGGIIPNQTRRNRSTPGEEGRIQRGMSPPSGLGEEIQNTRTLRVSPQAHAWGYCRAPSGLESAVNVDGPGCGTAADACRY
jgi:hypothetical protein